MFWNLFSSAITGRSDKKIAFLILWIEGELFAEVIFPLFIQKKKKIKSKSKDIFLVSIFTLSSFAIMISS